MIFRFSYQGQKGILDYNMWTGKSRLQWAGQDLGVSRKSWQAPDGIEIKLLRDKVILPALEINHEKVALVELKTWQWIFVLLPALLVFMGGAVPVGLGIGGVFFNASLFMDEDKSAAVKIIGSLAYTIGAVIVISVVSTLLVSVLG